MNFLSIDSTLEKIIFFVKIDNKSYSKTFQINKYNFENFINLLFNFLKENNLDLNIIKNIFVNVGPGNFSGIRTSIAIAKGLSISNKLKLFGYNTFLLAGRKFYDETIVLLIFKNNKSFFSQEFDINLQINSLPTILKFNELRMYKKKKLIIVEKNFPIQNNLKQIIKKNNLHIVKINYEDVPFLYNQNLVTKKLIKPLYLS